MYIITNCFARVHHDSYISLSGILPSLNQMMKSLELLLFKDTQVGPDESGLS